MGSYAQARQALRLLQEPHVFLLRRLGREYLEGRPLEVQESDVSDMGVLCAAGLADQLETPRTYQITPRGNELFAARRPCRHCRDDHTKGVACPCTTVAPGETFSA